MAEDEDSSTSDAENANLGGGRGKARRRSPRLKPDDLERIRTYQFDEADTEKVRIANLSRALEYLPAELRPEAEGQIRQALRRYLTPTDSQDKPSHAVLERYFGVLEAKARELASFLTQGDSLDQKWWPVDGAVPYPIVRELHLVTPLEQAIIPEEIRGLLAGLDRLCTAARVVSEHHKRIIRIAAERNEGKKGGRPQDWQFRLLLYYLQPLWEVASNRQEFIESCLAAIGETRKTEAIRKVFERLGHNGSE
jgi:hypothetical protein